MSDRSLTSKGFIGLLVTQLLGAMNDNLLKGVLTFSVAAGGVWAGQLGEGGQSYVALCLSIPFILFSGFSGQLADRSSKQKLAVALKTIEIGIALLGLAAFMMGNLWLAMGTMLMLAIHSAFFGPVKYGMIPEIVGTDRLSQANGAINLSTNLAIIIGTLIAGPIYSAFHPEDPKQLPILWAPGAGLLGIAIIGLAVSLFIPKLKAMDPELKVDWNPVGSYFTAFKEMRKGPLLAVSLAWSFFYLIGMVALLILPDYRDMLKITPTKASVLLGILGIAIGIGSALAGVISGRHIKPRLIPIGAIGMSSFFLLLGLIPLNYTLTAIGLFGAGVFAGFYIVPLQALLQYLSPADERGRFLGTANAMSFVASTLGSLIFLFAKKLHFASNHIFILCAAMAVPAIYVMLRKIRSLIAEKVIE